MLKKCSIIIPVFNQVSYTEKCLFAIFDTCNGLDIEVIVVNNGSSDSTPDLLFDFACKFSGLKIIPNKENLGFSNACNKGAENSDSENLVFLNNDTIPTLGWLEPLLDELSNKDIGIVGSKLIDPKTNLINHAGYAYNPKLGGFYPIYFGFPPDAPMVNKKREFQAFLGACIGIRKDVFKEVGGFANFGLEDIDLCLKVGEKGLKVMYIPTSVVYHFGSVTLTGNDKSLIPVNTTEEFKRRWPESKLVVDDTRYYSEDGLKIEILDNGEVRVLPL